MRLKEFSEMEPFDFSVLGKPVPKGSVHSFVPRRKDGSIVTRPDGAPMVVKKDAASTKDRQWGQALMHAAIDAMADAGATKIIGAPVELSIVFRKPRAKNHYGSGRNARVLKATAPSRPAIMPDIDKWIRAVLDALKDLVYVDDGQVVTLIASKVYVDILEPYRTDVSVRVLDDASEAQLGLLATA